VRRRTFLVLAASPTVLVPALAACSDATTPSQTPPLASKTLPSPSMGAQTLTAALAARRSVREYGPGRLTVEEVGQLLWAAQGVTSPEGFRTAPSAGALYPLTLYVVDASGLRRFAAADHSLQLLSPVDLRAALSVAALAQEPVAKAPSVFVVTGTPSRTAGKYGTRAERYVFLEAGHAAQNLLLQATALGLGGVSIGAFDDTAVADLLGLADGEHPIYLIPVGRRT
jgi:SagB-type dehydrogenase family enzyme